MNFARPITPATTGPVSIPIRTCSGRPVSATIDCQLRAHRQSHFGDRLRVVRPWDRHAGGDHVGITNRFDLLDAVTVRRV